MLNLSLDRKVIMHKTKYPERAWRCLTSYIEDLNKPEFAHKREGSSYSSATLYRYEDGSGFVVYTTPTAYVVRPNVPKGEEEP